jgi:hypothetical protein
VTVNYFTTRWLFHQAKSAFDFDLIRRVVIKVDQSTSGDLYMPANELGINWGIGSATSIDCYLAIGSKNQPIDPNIAAAID